MNNDLECKFTVNLNIIACKFRVLNQRRIEAVDESTESQSVPPASREVRHLKQYTNKTSGTNSETVTFGYCFHKCKNNPTRNLWKFKN